MKKIILLLVLAFSVLNLVSCDKESDCCKESSDSCCSESGQDCCE